MYKCILRKDDILNWIKFNPILQYREIAVVFEGGKIKSFVIGDGEHTFNQLTPIYEISELPDFVCGYANGSLLCEIVFSSSQEVDSSK